MGTAARSNTPRLSLPHRQSAIAAIVFTATGFGPEHVDRLDGYQTALGAEVKHPDDGLTVDSLRGLLEPLQVSLLTIGQIERE